MFSEGAPSTVPEPAEAENQPSVLAASNHEAFVSWMFTGGVAPNPTSDYPYDSIVAAIDSMPRATPAHEWAKMFLDGETVEEIAKISGRNHGTVYAALGSVAREIGYRF